MSDVVENIISGIILQILPKFPIYQIYKLEIPNLPQ